MTVERIVNRETRYAGRYLELQELTVRLPDGRTASREIVRVPDAVAVLPLDRTELAYLVRQHRPAVGKTLLEAPAGLIDPGEGPEEAAVRECEEEIGFRPGRLIRLVRYAHAEGYSSGFITLFIGTDLEPSGPLRLDETEHLENVRIPFSQLLEKVHSNEIQDSKTILASLFWAQMRGKPLGKKSIDFLDFGNRIT
jgi:ADP-ribose pyrophosphatase